jgi:hypothetical protein
LGEKGSLGADFKLPAKESEEVLPLVKACGTLQFSRAIHVNAGQAKLKQVGHYDVQHAGAAWLVKMRREGKIGNVTYFSGLGNPKQIRSALGFSEDTEVIRKENARIKASQA